MKLFISFLFILSFKLSAETLKKSIDLTYKQTRYLKATDIKLVSSGEMKIEEAKKITWNQMTPFSHKLIITQDEMLEENDGKFKKVENQVSEKMLSILFPLLNGKMESLKDEFDIKQDNESYDLIPKNPQFKKFIKSIHIEASHFVKVFKLSEMSGNTLEIKFSPKK